MKKNSSSLTPIGEESSLSDDVRQHDLDVMRARLIGMAEFQERLGVGKSTAFDLVLSGRVRSVKVGRRRLVPESALIAFIEHGEAVDQ